MQNAYYGLACFPLRSAEGWGWDSSHIFFRGDGRRGRVTSSADVILAGAIHSQRHGEHFHLDAHLAGKIPRGCITVTSRLLSLGQNGARDSISEINDHG